ncbi:MAG: DNA damage-inducible protein D [Elusimicrobiota bacterium]|jgi:DNA-damage-inducible protein D|nr:DNA damage-inducible protein D [Elusimicrobiota bacterium]
MTGLTNGKNPFENIKFIDNDGNERWAARDLAVLLGYEKWDNFENTIEKAKISAKNSNIEEEYHFPEISKMVSLGSGSQRKIKDYALSRYACYLVIQNADPSKPMVASGQTYFAVQTRRAELADSFPQLNEDQKRLQLRDEMKFHNKQLAAAARSAGVETPFDYAIFQDYGYKGLYGGLGMKDIHKKKGLKKSQQILDHMGSTELAANLFRATQTEEKLRKDKIKTKSKASQTHQEVGRKVRQAIKNIGGTMPENLPTPEESIKKVERKIRKLENKD